MKKVEKFNEHIIHVKAKEAYDEIIHHDAVKEHDEVYKTSIGYVYIANDGTEFESEKKCFEYEWTTDLEKFNKFLKEHLICVFNDSKCIFYKEVEYDSILKLSEADLKYIKNFIDNHRYRYRCYHECIIDRYKDIKIDSNDSYLFVRKYEEDYNNDGPDYCTYYLVAVDAAKAYLNDQYDLIKNI